MKLVIRLVLFTIAHLETARDVQVQIVQIVVLVMDVIVKVSL
jgi:hypothetical protein